LTDQELAGAVVDVELHRQGAGLRVNDAGVVHVIRLHDQRIRPPGNLHGDLFNGRTDWRV
jgi:hypothetical protein